MTDKILKPLKIYSTDANDIALIETSKSCTLEADPLLANVWLTNPNVFGTNIDTVLGFFTNGRSHPYMMNPITSIIDQHSMMQFVETKSTKFDEISTSPRHLFIDNNSFKIFQDRFNGIKFDFIKIDNGGETIIDTDTLENIVQNHQLLLKDGIDNVWFNKEPKYFVRIPKPANSNFMQVYGGIFLDENGNSVFTTNIRIPAPIIALVKHMMAGFIGFFRIEFYKNVNKYEIYKFELKFDKKLLEDDAQNNLMVGKMLAALGDYNG